MGKGLSTVLLDFPMAYCKMVLKPLMDLADIDKRPMDHIANLRGSY